MNRTPLILILSIMMTLNCHAGVENLRCEYLENPLGIDVVTPRLSWTTKTQERGWMQGAYQVLVASSEEKLAQDEGDLWDSGKVESDQSIHVEYTGKPLTSRMQCFWKVRVWDEKGKVSAWSEPARWSMGLLEVSGFGFQVSGKSGNGNLKPETRNPKPSAWKAEWIGLDKEPELPPVRRADLQGKGHKVVVQKALYGVKGDPKKQVDIKQRLQQQVDAGQLLVTASNELAGQDPAHGIKKVLEFACRVDDWDVKGTVPENAVWDLTTGQKVKQYLPAPHLRKEFQVTSPIKRAVLYATAQGVVELSLNGRRVGDEVFTPGWTDYRKRIYYRTYDVTDLLHEGPNAMGAMLGDGWFRGNISVSGQNQYGKRLRLKAQLHIEYDDGQSDVIVSDPSWKAAYGPILESDMQAGEVYDARREMPGWDRAGYDASGWSPVVAGSEIKPLLQAYPGVPVRPVQELPTVKLTEPQPGQYVFDLGQNFSGWIRLKVKGEAGDKIDMLFGEMLKEDGTAYTINLRSARAVDTYILKGGEEEVWEPRFTFHGFRYVQISGLREKPAPDAVTGIVLYSDSPEASSFECSNPMVNKIYENIVWGQRSNYLEVPTDCPQRDERLGWTGDTQVFIRTGCYNQDVSAFFTKWIVDLMDTQNAQGLFGNQAPVFHGHGAAAWACAGIISPWTIYKVYGDTRVIEENYDAMVRYMDACGKDGLGGRKAHTWGDWLAPGARPPKELISTAYFAYTTSLMAEMAEALGKKEDAAKYNKQFQDIRVYFQKTFVKPDGKIESNLQTAYCMALKFNLLTEAQRKQAEAHLLERIKADNYHLSVGFLGIPILFPTLTDMGHSDLAYRMIQNETYPSWGYSIAQGATTIWERWNSYSKDKGFGDVKMNSFNHYALGAVGEWMFRSMLGIETDGAGFKKIIMKPEVPVLSGVEGGEGITWAKGHYDSIHGRIESDWKVEGDRFEWKITVPANTTATVYVPVASKPGEDGPATDAASVTESGKPVDQAEGAKFLRMEAGRAVFEVGAGTYAFKEGSENPPDTATVACYYFPNYHPGDARNQALKGEGWSEWELVKEAKPRFEGHHQPNMPVWGYTDESDPKQMAQKIEAAASHGIDAFIFDWYWFDDGPFLERGLDEGFLKAPNNDRIKFSLMWANHDWVDIHPYKRGTPAGLLYPGKVKKETFDHVCKHVISKYFNHPSYWKIDGKPYFSIYELNKLMESFGSVEATRDALDAFRAQVMAAGMPGLHLNAVVWGRSILPGEKKPADPADVVKRLGFDSVTSYVWIHHVGLPKLQTDFTYVQEKYFNYWTKAETMFDIPYYPNVTMGWDSSPRAHQDDPFGHFGYPFMNTISGNTPERFEQALRATKQRLEQGGGPRILTINCWNEWTEGSYLEPDTRNGMAYLEAVKKVFGEDADKAEKQENKVEVSVVQN